MGRLLKLIVGSKKTEKGHGEGSRLYGTHPLKSGAEDRREKIRLEPVKLTRVTRYKVIFPEP